MKKSIAVNTFKDGLIMDFYDAVTPETALTDCLNGTFLTYNGNELSLQNDMGNSKVETCRLPEGYIPIGICSLGGIIYIASYNPDTGKGQIGSFPSPERNFSSEENGSESFKFTLTSIIKNETRSNYPDIQLSNINEDYVQIISDEQNLDYNTLKTYSYRQLFQNSSIHPGDLYVIGLDKNKNGQIELASKIFEEFWSDKSIEFENIVKITPIISFLDGSIKELDTIPYKMEYGDISEDTNISSDLHTETEYAVVNANSSGQLGLKFDIEAPSIFSSDVIVEQNNDELSYNIELSWDKQPLYILGQIDEEQIEESIEQEVEKINDKTPYSIFNESGTHTLLLKKIQNKDSTIFTINKDNLGKNISLEKLATDHIVHTFSFIPSVIKSEIYVPWLKRTSTIDYRQIGDGNSELTMWRYNYYESEDEIKQMVLEYRIKATPYNWNPITKITCEASYFDQFAYVAIADKHRMSNYTIGLEGIDTNDIIMNNPIILFTQEYNSTQTYLDKIDVLNINLGTEESENGVLKENSLYLFKISLEYSNGYIKPFYRFMYTDSMWNGSDEIDYNNISLNVDITLQQEGKYKLPLKFNYKNACEVPDLIELNMLNNLKYKGISYSIEDQADQLELKLNVNNENLSPSIKPIFNTINNSFNFYVNSEIVVNNKDIQKISIPVYSKIQKIGESDKVKVIFEKIENDLLDNEIKFSLNNVTYEELPDIYSCSDVDLRNRIIDCKSITYNFNPNELSFDNIFPNKDIIINDLYSNEQDYIENYTTAVHNRNDNDESGNIDWDSLNDYNRIYEFSEESKSNQNAFLLKTNGKHPQGEIFYNIGNHKCNSVNLQVRTNVHYGKTNGIVRLELKKETDDTTFNFKITQKEIEFSNSPIQLKINDVTIDPDLYIPNLHISNMSPQINDLLAENPVDCEVSAVIKESVLLYNGVNHISLILNQYDKQLVGQRQVETTQEKNPDTGEITTAQKTIYTWYPFAFIQSTNNEYLPCFTRHVEYIENDLICDINPSNYSSDTINNTLMKPVAKYKRKNDRADCWSYGELNIDEEIESISIISVMLSDPEELKALKPFEGEVQYGNIDDKRESRI